MKFPSPEIKPRGEVGSREQIDRFRKELHRYFGLNRPTDEDMRAPYDYMTLSRMLNMPKGLDRLLSQARQVHDQTAEDLLTPICGKAKQIFDFIAFKVDPAREEEREFLKRAYDGDSRAQKEYIELNKKILELMEMMRDFNVE
ncbi:MAG: hypothetical protein WC750_02785 [Patescibacteria group bacterium]|jgi:hypothetical protein